MSLRSTNHGTPQSRRRCSHSRRRAVAGCSDAPQQSTARRQNATRECSERSGARFPRPRLIDSDGRQASLLPFLKLLIGPSICLRVSIVISPCPTVVLLSVPIAVVAEPLPAVWLVVPVALLALIPVIAASAFPTPLITVPLPLSLVPLIPLVFRGSEQAGR